MARQRLGGSFAPPLTDNLLAQYRALIDGLDPKSRVRDALEQLYRCVAQWWALPDSKRKGRKHPVGVGVIVDLEEEHAQALWDAIPWDHELDEMARLFDEIEREACARNSRQIEAWHGQVRDDLRSKHFPEQPWPKKLLDWMRRAGEELGFLLGLLPDGERKRAEQQLAAAAEFARKYRFALASKSYPDLPYPARESTPLRDAAHHLLWHVRELNLDREPVTNDKL
jgi:hypothetical protein